MGKKKPAVDFNIVNGKKKRGPGQPTKLTPSVKEKISFLSRKGFTDAEMAMCVDVTEQTFNNWKKQQPAFFESLSDWKKKPNKEVERSLFERACGYEHPETKSQYVAGEGWQQITVTKHYPPDPTSMIFWLKNRQPAKWRDKTDLDLNQTVDLNLSEKDKDLFRKAAKEISQRVISATVKNRAKKK